MINIQLKVKGDKKLRSRVQQITSKLPSASDRAVHESALYGHGELTRATPVSRPKFGKQETASGSTRRGWRPPIRVESGVYRIEHPQEVVIRTLDTGSRPHEIRPRKAKMLRFPSPKIWKSLESNPERENPLALTRILRKGTAVKYPFVLVSRVFHPGLKKGYGILKRTIPKIEARMLNNFKRLVDQLVKG